MTGFRPQSEGVILLPNILTPLLTQSKIPNPPKGLGDPIPAILTQKEIKNTQGGLKQTKTMSVLQPKPMTPITGAAVNFLKVPHVIIFMLLLWQILNIRKIRQNSAFTSVDPEASPHTSQPPPRCSLHIPIQTPHRALSRSQSQRSSHCIHRHFGM